MRLSLCKILTDDVCRYICKNAIILQIVNNSLKIKEYVLKSSCMGGGRGQIITQISLGAKMQSFYIVNSDV